MTVQYIKNDENWDKKEKTKEKICRGRKKIVRFKTKV